MARCDDCGEPAYGGGASESGPWAYCGEHYFQRVVDGRLPPPICDFCSSKNIVGGAVYGCEDFHAVAVGIRIGGFTFSAENSSKSIGDWCACPQCVELIDREEWGDLRRRSADHYVLFNREADRAEAEQWIGTMHKGFRENRTGEVRRLV